MSLVMSMLYQPGIHLNHSRLLRHDFDAAGILLDVSQEPHAISTPPKLGDIVAATVHEPEEDAISKSSWTCPVSTCIYHRKRFSLKTEREKHTRIHFEGMGCATLAATGRQSFLKSSSTFSPA